MVNFIKLFSGIYNGKRILITGDTGFKGSWLSLWLNEMGAEVYGYALPPKTEKDNYVVCKLNNIIKHEDGDIRDRDHLLNYFKEVNPHIAFHLAAQPLVLDSYNSPHYTYETNLMGTVNFFEAVRISPKIKAAVNITSDKCYENNEWIWGYRENDPMGGKDPYSSSKGCSELITSSYISSFFTDSECNIASVRAGNVIGAGDWSENRVVPDFFRAFIDKQTLKIRNPSATRPWQHVLESLGGYLLLAAKLYNDPSLSGGWNFGPKEEMNYKVYELIKLLQGHSPGISIEYSDDITTKEAGLLKLDISKAVFKLKWQPVLSFEDTVKLTADGYISDFTGKDALQNRIDAIHKYLITAIDRYISWFK